MLARCQLKTNHLRNTSRPSISGEKFLTLGEALHASVQQCTFVSDNSKKGRIVEQKMNVTCHTAFSDMLSDKYKLRKDSPTIDTHTRLK